MYRAGFEIFEHEHAQSTSTSTLSMLAVLSAQPFQIPRAQPCSCSAVLEKGPCSAVLVLSHAQNAVLNAEHALEHGTDFFFHFFALRIQRF